MLVGGIALTITSLEGMNLTPHLAQPRRLDQSMAWILFHGFLIAFWS